MSQESDVDLKSFRMFAGRSWSLRLMFALMTLTSVFVAFLPSLFDFSPPLDGKKYWSSVRGLLSKNPQYMVQLNKDYFQDQHLFLTNLPTEGLPLNEGDPGFDSRVTAICIPIRCSVGDRELKEIGEIETLQMVWICFDGSSEFGKEGVASLAKLPNLKWLVFQGRVSHESMIPLRNCKSLQKLTVFSCSEKAPIIDLLNLLPNLVKVEIGGDTFSK